MRLEGQISGLLVKTSALGACVMCTELSAAMNNAKAGTVDTRECVGIGISIIFSKFLIILSKSYRDTTIGRRLLSDVIKFEIICYCTSNQTPKWKCNPISVIIMSSNYSLTSNFINVIIFLMSCL